MQRHTRNTLLLGGGIAILVLALVVAGGHFISSSKERAALERQQARIQESQALAGSVGTSLGSYRQELSRLSGDAALAQLMLKHDQAALNQRAALLAPRFKYLLKLRLLPADIQEPDSASNPPLTYASLDMMLRARNSTTQVSPEVHLLGSPAQHLVMLQSVRQDGQVVGFIHLSLDVALLQTVLDSLELKGGYLELLQPVDKGKPLVLARAGNVARKSGPAISARVPGTQWQLATWLDTTVALPSEGGSPWWLLLASGLLVLLVLIGIGLFIWKRRMAREDDSVTYEGAVKAIMFGAHPGLERLIPGLPNRSGETPTVPLSQGLEGDDITHIARPSTATGEDITRPPAPKGPPTPAEAGIEVEEIDSSTVDLDFSAAGGEEQAIPQAETLEGTGMPPLAATNQGGGDVAIEALAGIFRAYDIRGIVGKTLTEDSVYAIGRAIGSEAYARGQQALAVARDGRNSGPALSEALIRGLRDSGRDVIDIGMVPTPVLYFATFYLETGSGVMLTGSHNPPDYNGLKIMLGGETLSGDAIQALYQRIIAGDFTSGEGDLQHADIGSEYIRRISEDIPVALGNAFKVVVDCGNGVAGALAPQLIRALGHDVDELYCEVDGNFPNHHPDPSQPENLRDLCERVKEEDADLGLAFDGDGDRLGVVDGNGKIIWPDRQMMLFAKDVLSRNPCSEIIFDVKCSRHLRTVIEASDGKPLMWKTGHSFIKAKMKEDDAPLAGEMSGHIFFKERWYGFDDGLYAAARLLEILTNESGSPTEVLAALPEGVSTPELRLDLPEDRHADIMQALVGKADFADGEVSTIDGLRVDFSDGWGLVRASNTTPCLILRFEADDETALERIKGQFRELIQAVDPGLSLPF